MSRIALAEAIDRLVETQHAHVTETDDVVVVSALAPEPALDLCTRCSQLGWHAELFDRAGDAWPANEPPVGAYGPFRLTIRKPAAPAGTLQLLSNHAFSRWLRQNPPVTNWHVARLDGPIATRTHMFQPWDGTETAPPPTVIKSPRALVREFGAQRRVPEQIGPWLSAPLEDAAFATPAAQVWVAAATQALMHALPDEIDPEDGGLKFRGPPRLVLPSPTVGDAPLGRATFNVLQAASNWVFENNREAEMRHILLATELARSGADADQAGQFLAVHLADAWESAQLAYQMALADTSRDTLKVLGDLRKAVGDETAKLNDMGRQLAASVAAAVATGIGLVAARIAASTPWWLNLTVTVVVTMYVAMIVMSGVHFIRLQRSLRSEWQPRLYRFLLANDYTRMVDTPVAKAEHGFFRIAWWGGAAVLLITLACLLPWPETAQVAASSARQQEAPLPPAGHDVRAHTPARGDAAQPPPAPLISPAGAPPGKVVPGEKKGARPAERNVPSDTPPPRAEQESSNPRDTEGGS
ncbi:hypothetical protein [uncultured Stenotrophomonas sp.]|uniref:hypothetical protein n=1 Tax=uncultured Stenotrophomonas sp. TaxID=165438 RepID=UPI0025D81EB7|nr:hypothetical protein [uncultured Stenotrophomonas sp.]